MTYFRLWDLLLPNVRAQASRELSSGFALPASKAIKKIIKEELKSIGNLELRAKMLDLHLIVISVFWLIISGRGAFVPANLTCDQKIFPAVMNSVRNRWFVCDLYLIRFSKYHWISVEENPPWEAHIEEISKTISAGLLVLRRISPTIPFETRWKLCTKPGAHMGSWQGSYRALLWLIRG